MTVVSDASSLWFESYEVCRSLFFSVCSKPAIVSFFVCYAEGISSNLYTYKPLHSLPDTLYFGQVSQALKNY